MADQRIGPGGPPRLEVGTLVSGALARLRDSLQALAPIAAGWTLATIALQYGAQATGAAASATSLSWEYVAFAVVSALVNAVFFTPTARIMLGRPQGAWRWDGGFFRYLAWAAGVGLGSAVLVMLMVGAPSGGVDASPEELAAYGGRVLVVFLMFPVLLWVVMRLLLWPIGMVMNEPSMTAGRSWRLMRGAVFAYIVAAVALNVLPSLLVSLAALRYTATGSLLWLVPIGPLGAISAQLSAALTAEVYRRRTGGDDVGRVFD